MFDIPYIIRDRPELDPLTQTIALLRPRALLWKQMEARGAWAIRFPSHGNVVFSLVERGRCVLRVAGEEPRWLDEGDFALLTAPPEWILGDQPGTAAVAHDGARAAQSRVAHLGDRDTGPVTRVIGGYFAFEDAAAALVRGVSPAMVIIHSSDIGATRLRRVLDLIGDEAAADRSGRTVILERLLEVMLVEAIRHEPASEAETSPGLLAGLADPRIGAALQALHGDIRQGWTVARLAAAAGMSRSAFAGRFSRIVGLAPIDYLLHWRMAVAKDALRRGERLATVALDCGYQSASAFSVAFSRTVGRPPSRYAANLP
jgi:AraC-like DNA-binding protein